MEFNELLETNVSDLIATIQTATNANSVVNITVSTTFAAEVPAGVEDERFADILKTSVCGAVPCDITVGTSSRRRLQSTTLFIITYTIHQNFLPLDVNVTDVALQLNMSYSDLNITMQNHQINTRVTTVYEETTDTSVVSDLQYAIARSLDMEPNHISVSQSTVITPPRPPPRPPPQTPPQPSQQSRNPPPSVGKPSNDSRMYSSVYILVVVVVLITILCRIRYKARVMSLSSAVQVGTSQVATGMTVAR